jgi:hypothetical protein
VVQTSQPPAPTPAHIPSLFGDRRRRLLLLGALLAGAGVLYGATVVLTTRRPPRTMTDAAFVRQADALCAKTLPKLRAVRPASGSTDKAQSLSALAARVDNVSDGLARFVSDLRAVPVRAENQARVDEWFHQWDDYVAIGHRYATAVRTGNDKRYSAVAKEGVVPVRAVAKFARGNHIDNCVP